jgi:hypothetical protein
MQDRQNYVLQVRNVLRAVTNTFLTKEMAAETSRCLSEKGERQYIFQETAIFLAKGIKF